MPSVHRLQLPLTDEKVRTLSLGDTVYLDGEVVVVGTGLPAHDRILRCIEEGTPLPIDLQGATILHFGTYSRIVDDKYQVLYMNPTTSARFNRYMPKIISTFGLKAVGGKGGFDRATAQAMKQEGCVYLSFLGGGCAVLSESIREVMAVEWNDLIFQYRLVKLRVEGLGPATVGIDAEGNSLYDDLMAQAEERLPLILRELEEARNAEQSRRS